MLRGYGPFKVLSKVGANVYKLELPRDMAILATFNVGDVSPYVEDEIDYEDLRSNPFKGGRMMHVKHQFRAFSLSKIRICSLISYKTNSMKASNAHLRLV